MKLKLLAAVIIGTSLFCSIQLQAQATYFSFPDSNAVWTEQAQGCCYNYCPPPPNPNPVLLDLSFSYYIQGDTIINGAACHKIYQSGITHEHCNFGNYINNWGVINNIYTGAYRQDITLKKVLFIYPGDTTQCLLYDFNLNVGDTINYGCNNWGGCFIITVTSIDSILIGNTYRKRFNLSNFPSYSLIEGIGSTSGLLEPICPFEYFGTLICFSQNGQSIYPDTTTICQIITETNEGHHKPGMVISPNPASDKINISFPATASENVTIKIYSITGEIVLEEENIYPDLIGKSKAPFSNFQLPISNFQNGIYFLSVQTEKEKITRKIAVQH